jgi:hypothetical protein
MTPAGYFALLRNIARQCLTHCEATQSSIKAGYKTNVELCNHNTLRSLQELARTLDQAEAEILQRELFT